MRVTEQEHMGWAGLNTRAHWERQVKLIDRRLTERRKDDRHKGVEQTKRFRLRTPMTLSVSHEAEMVQV